MRLDVGLVLVASSALTLVSCSLIVDPVQRDPGSGLCLGSHPNGITERTEICDDGNAYDDDACLSTCEPAQCGDGYLRKYLENCDDDQADCQECVRCAANEASANGRCYSLHNSPSGWSGARGDCFNADKELATFPGLNNKGIALLLDELAAVIEQPLPSEMWIGLTYESTKWTWVGGDGDAMPPWADGPVTGDWRGLVDPLGRVTSAQNGEQHPFLCMRAPTANRLGRDAVTGHYYLEESTSLTPNGGTGDFDDAATACTLREAELLEITSAAEWELVQGFLTGPTFIGLRRGDSAWKWESGAEHDAVLLPVAGATGDCAAYQEGALQAVSCSLAGAKYACEWN